LVWAISLFDVTCFLLQNSCINLSLTVVHVITCNLYFLAKMPGKLTTHVLDTAHGCPAAGIAIELWQVSPSGDKTLLKSVHTNADGRTDVPLLAAEELQLGMYELVFAIGDYFDRLMESLPTPRFLDRIPIQFGVADPAVHYHVPLLVSPWSYSTYRGS
jgi:5-hydroxyisourate hydrolase